MKNIFAILALVACASQAQACTIRGGLTGGTTGSCQRSHHWENGQCVHNGREHEEHHDDNHHDEHHDRDGHHDEHHDNGHHD